MLFMQRMAIVNYNSLAALYNIRQKFEYVPPKMHYDFVNLFLFLNRFENHLKRKAIFVPF